MTGCRISAAKNQGAHLLRLEGDVRLVMCTALEEYFERVFNDQEFLSVWVDVTGATGLDSTTLGMLAKLAIKTHEKFGFRPTIFSANPGIDRLLQTMGFAQLFDVRNEACEGYTHDIPAHPSTESEIKERVIEAHKTLMAMSEANRDAFQDLVRTLEAT
ncbi:MAG: STAS domain-containing protein [Luminiphilus sp.]|nr:STAS domain-containing protein [Luminiphilus sp.]